MRGAAGAIAVGLSLLCATAASAQIYVGRDVPRRGSIEAGGGGFWLQRLDLDPRTAQLSRPTPGQRFDLFTTAGSLDPAAGVRGRVGVFLTSSISVEAGVGYARPPMSIRITGDAETGEDTVATQRVSHYVFDGSVLFHLRRAAFAGGRGIPFFSIGGGHLRELHEGNELVETGTVYHGTAGVKYWLGSRRRVGLRGEAGFTSREGGATGPGERRLVPIVSGGISYLF